MPTLNQIRNSIREQVTGYMATDDTRLEDGFIDNIVRTKRSLIIRDRAKNGLGVESAFYQDLPCIEVTHGSAMCEGVQLDPDESMAIIPAVEAFRGSIAYFGSVSGKHPYGEMGLSAYLNATGGRFCVSNPVYTKGVGVIRIKFMDKQVERVRLLAVLEDPAANSCLLDFEDSPYPVPLNIVHQLETLCLKQIMSTLPITPDTANNGTDDQGQSSRLNPNQL